jgi:hypothetical protein
MALRATKPDENRCRLRQDFISEGGRDRNRSGEVEAVKELIRIARIEPMIVTRPFVRMAAAVKKKGSVFQQLFRRFLPRLTYKEAIRAIAHRIGRLAWKILPQGVHYTEKGAETTPQARKRRRQKLTQALRKPGYAITYSPEPRLSAGARALIFRGAVRVVR